jgi:hypothetical protein
MPHFASGSNTRCAAHVSSHRVRGCWGWAAARPALSLERSISSAFRRADAFGFLVLSVFNDFGVRVITLRTFECAPVVIGFVWLDATKPHRCATVRALRRVDTKSRTQIEKASCAETNFPAAEQNSLLNDILIGPGSGFFVQQRGAAGSPSLHQGSVCGAG